MVGVDTSDDAAVYRIDDNLAIIQTLDFFTPVVDDPYVYGQIAATNSLSDVYAMGGEPKLALNIVCFPDCLDPEILGEILRGGADKIKESGALLVGGHSVSDDEPKYGLSVTGFVHPDKVLTNADLREGDLLVLTKPVGLGIINTAIKADMAEKEVYDEAVKVMSTLNKYAKEAIDRAGGAHALTDITGFGLLGHALEMAEGSNLSVRIESDKVPVISGARELARMGIIPAGAYANRNHVGNSVYFSEGITEDLKDVLFDPQTSGGLLVSIDKDHVDDLLKELENTPTDFAVVGQVCKKQEHYIIVE